MPRWGCKLSQKLFVGKEYVLKHIRLKHAAVMEAQREEVCTRLVWLHPLPCMQTHERLMPLLIIHFFWLSKLGLFGLACTA